MSLLGIDVGTTGCKAAAFALDGRCLAFAYREYAPVSPRPGYAELDSRQIMRLVREVIAEVAGKTAGDPVTAMSFSSLGESMTPVTRHREILGNSLLMSDTRGGDLLEKVLGGMDREEFYRINPNIPGTHYSLPKVLWLKKHQPDIYEKADHFLLWADLVPFLFGGDPATNYSLANRTLLFDLHREEWSQTLLDRSGIDPAKLPVPRPAGTVVGTIDRRIASELGLPAGVTMVVGGHDQCCNALGAGLWKAGSAVCGIGSYECITPVYDHVPEPRSMLKYGLNVEHHVLPGLYVSFIYNQGGLLVKWFRDTFAAADARLLGEKGSVYAELDKEMPVDPTRLVVLPYFDITGPPEFISNASGVIAGLKTSTQRGEILKAILEGETFYFMESLEALHAMGIRADEFVATGGGARSDAWLQLKADVYGVPFIRPRYTEASLLGAAIVAGLATGVFNTSEEAVNQFVARERVFEPDSRRHGLYRERYGRYRELFPMLRTYLSTL